VNISPGFTAESALREMDAHYATVATREYVSGDQMVLPQIRPGSLREASGPFSGSCGCGPGFCCCIFCYFTSCYWWCYPTLTRVA
jgi:hypothetical protein